MTNDKTSEDRYNESRDRVLAYKENHALFTTLPNGERAPQVAFTKPLYKKSVLDTLKGFVEKASSIDKKKDKETKKNEKKKEPMPMGLDKIAEKDKKLGEKKKEFDIDALRNKPEGKDTKGKDAEKEKDGKKLSPEQREAVQNQEKKMKEAFAKVKLPSGMEVHQEGPKWVLVGKNGARTDITDCMNAIDEYNKSVDAENAAQKGVNEASKDANKKDHGLHTSETNGKAQINGQGTEVDKQAVVSQWLQKEVKLPDNQPAIKPEDTKALAETALKYSDEKELLSKLKNPKDLENEANEKDKQNKEKNDYLKQMYGKTNTGR